MLTLNGEADESELWDALRIVEFRAVATLAGDLDEDWFVFELGDAAHVEVEVYALADLAAPSAQVGVALFAEMPLDAPGEPMDPLPLVVPGEDVLIELAAGVYYLRVNGQELDGRQTYQLDVRARRICPPRKALHGARRRVRPRGPGGSPGAAGGCKNDSRRAGGAAVVAEVGAFRGGCTARSCAGTPPGPAAIRRWEDLRS